MCRAGDMVARYGGEEFVFIAPNCNAAQAHKLGVKLHKAFETLELPHQAADQALYQAKEQGRNRAVCRTMEEPFTTQ